MHSVNEIIKALEPKVHGDDATEKLVRPRFLASHSAGDVDARRD